MPSRGRRHGRGSKASATPPNDAPTNADSTKPSMKPEKKPPLTHFLCIPLVNDTTRPILTASLRRFREEAGSLVRAKAEEAEAEGATRGARADYEKLLEVLEKDERAVRPVGTLHLTLGVMSLAEAKPNAADAGEKKEGDASTRDAGTERKTFADAKAFLESLDFPSLIGSTSATTQAPDEVSTHAPSNASESSPAPLRVSLKGLRSMHAPAKTSFLYTSPSDSTERVQPFCQRLKDAFVDKGMMLDEKNRGKLKLHTTVLNTIYARPGKRKGTMLDESATGTAVPEARENTETSQTIPGDEHTDQVEEDTAGVDQEGEHDGLHRGASQDAAYSVSSD